MSPPSWLLLASAAISAALAAYASLDGSNNNLAHPDWSQSNTIFQPRNTYFADGVSAVDGTLPNVRNVSNQVRDTRSQNARAATPRH